jgi:hypothetical protein
VVVVVLMKEGCAVHIYMAGWLSDRRTNERSERCRRDDESERENE